MTSNTVSKSIWAASFLAVGMLGYQLGAGQRHQPVLQTVTLENVQVSQIHPAALYIRNAAGKEQRFLMDALERDWASTLQEHPGRRWHLELTTSLECPHRYRLQTAVGQAE